MYYLVTYDDIVWLHAFHSLEELLLDCLVLFGVLEGEQLVALLVRLKELHRQSSLSGVRPRRLGNYQPVVTDLDSSKTQQKWLDVTGNTRFLIDNRLCEMHTLFCYRVGYGAVHLPRQLETRKSSSFRFLG